MKRNTTRFALTIALALFVLATALPASAWERGWRGGGWHGGGWRGGDGWRGDGWRGGWGGWGMGAGLVTGAMLGAELANPYPYYYPYYSSAVVVQQPAIAVAPSDTTMVVAPSNNAPAMWYYCDSSHAYYPYVSSCPQPWRAVPAVPPGAQGN